MSKDFFDEGYRYGIGLNSNDNNNDNDSPILLKDVMKNGTYADCEEWYKGFYKAALELSLLELKQLYCGIKQTTN